MTAAIPKSALESKAGDCAVRFAAEKIVKVTARAKNLINYDNEA
jgi:hypothetical protein